MSDRKVIGSKNRHSKLRRTKWKVRSRWRWFKDLKRWQKVALIASPVLAFLVIVPVVTYIYFYNDISNQDRLMNRNNTGVVLMDVHGETFYNTGRAQHRDMVPLEEISPHIIDAVISSEDKNFYEHSGFSIWSTLRALYTNILVRDATGYGGSTITQQLAKNTLLTSNQTLMRKYQELVISIAIENRYTKDEILEMYLNSVYFGNNAFGIKMAATNYFSKSPAELTLAESAMLIGVLPAPSAYSPVTGDMDLAVGRQKEVLKRMVTNSKITEEEKVAAEEETLVYQPPTTIDNDAPHFTEMVLLELYDKYGEERVERSGFQITTSLDLNMQRQALNNVSSRVRYIQSMGGSNAGLIAIDPKTGEIRALVGSVDYSNPDWGAVNMATAKRQPGSSFKPIYYAAALADGEITPATVIKDEPININGFSPENATKRYYGQVSVRQALARSLNIPAVKIMQQYGIDRSIEAAQDLGITTLNDAGSHGLSLAIGSAEVPLEQITNAYAAFANRGRQHKSTTIYQIKDRFNKIIYTRKDESKRAISEEGAFLISSILSDNQARSAMFGSSLTVPGKTVAVKTGTTDDNRDAWAVGYTPDIAVGVWVGNNDNSTMVSGGADMAGPIWRQSMINFIGASDPRFTIPSGVVERSVCYGGGGLADSSGVNTYREYFLVTALPEKSCNAIAEPEEPEEVESDPEPKPEPRRPESDEVEEEPASDEGSGGGTGDDGGGNTNLPPVDGGGGNQLPGPGTGGQQDGTNSPDSGGRRGTGLLPL